MSRELFLFARAILYGAVMAAGYDGFRILRGILIHGEVRMAVEDLFYWIGSGLFLFSRIYLDNSGIVRGYFLFGVLLGAVFYHETVSDRVVAGGLRVLRIVIKSTKRLKFAGLRCKISLGKGSDKSSESREDL